MKRKHPQPRSKTLRLTLSDPWLGAIEAFAKQAGVGIVPYMIETAWNYPKVLQELVKVDQALKAHTQKQSGEEIK